MKFKTFVFTNISDRNVADCVALHLLAYSNLWARLTSPPLPAEALKVSLLAVG